MVGSNNRSLATSTSAKRMRSPNASKSTTKRKPRVQALVKSVGWAFPPQYHCDMFYSEVITMSIASGAFQQYGFRVNGLYDPNGSGTGSFPLYFSTLSAVYNKYAVVSSTFDIQITTPASSATPTTPIVAVYVDDDGSWAPSMQSVLNRPKVKSMIVNTAAGNPAHLQAYFSSALTFGNATPWTDDTLCGTASANPANLSNYIINVEDPGGQTYAMYIKVHMKFRVAWFDLKTITL